VRVNRHLSSTATKAARSDLNVAADDGRWRAIWDVERDRVTLYDTTADPAEARDLAAEAPDRAAALGAVARGWARGRWPADVVPGDGSVQGMEAETVDRLRELGYVE
jgi:arylsulfatase A-like enzyme